MSRKGKKISASVIEIVTTSLVRRKQRYEGNLASITHCHGFPRCFFHRTRLCNISVFHGSVADAVRKVKDASLIRQIINRRFFVRCMGLLWFHFIV